MYLEIVNCIAWISTDDQTGISSCFLVSLQSVNSRQKLFALQPIARSFLNAVMLHTLMVSGDTIDLIEFY